MHLCVILNGPPNCGKDTLSLILETYGFTPMAFKDQLYEDTAEEYGVPLDELLYRAKDRQLKEEIWGLTNKTPRQMLIHTSERVLKPREGLDYFGKAAARNCKRDGAILAVFSDGGFPEEIPPLQEMYTHTVIIRLHREDCNFSQDSRDYLQGFENTHDVYLEFGNLVKAVDDVLDVVEQYFG